jgi:pimeloyl-ACP methyl ester carboxylesterase
LKKESIFYLDPAPNNTKTILLIHGLGADSSSWQLQFNVLIENGYRPIAVDVPGFGKSKYPFRRWTIRKAAYLIVEKIIDQIPGKICLIGLSLGGVVAQQIMRIRPEKIEKAILVSTFSHLRPGVGNNLPYLRRRIIQVFSGNIVKQAKLVADRIFPDKDQKEVHDYLLNQIKHANPRIYRQAMIALATFNSRFWMKKVSFPCLVVTGMSDTTVTVANQKRLVNLLQYGQWIKVNGGGHAVNVDHSNEFNEIMIHYLNTVPTINN